MKDNECYECEGTGVVAYSCCGDIIYPDTELCPSCNDYTVYEEQTCDCQIK
jgi:RNA polymerase subunit RPABC4/transcription elongation factor Spt4